MIFIAYRSNQLFDKYVPGLVKGLPVTETFIIPAGTSFSDVRAAAFAATERAQRKGAATILLDFTCTELSELRVSPEEEWPKKRFHKTVSLDYLFASEVDRQSPGSTVAQNFVRFARLVVDEKPVTTVVVVQESLGDHEFAGTNKPFGQFMDAKAVAWIVGQVKELFPKSAVNVVATLDKALESADDPATLVVCDRHCGVKEVMGKRNGMYGSYANWPYPAMLYMLPFESCAAHLAGLSRLDFTFDLAKMQQEILGA
jgi:hypothetical protein